MTQWLDFLRIWGLHLDSPSRAPGIRHVGYASEKESKCFEQMFGGAEGHNNGDMELVE